MIRKIFTYITLLLAMTACSVDEFNTPSGLGPDGELTVNLSVPDLQVVTRDADPEFAISDVTLLVVSNGKVEQEETFSASAGTLKGEAPNYSISCQISPKIRNNTDIKLYFIANVPTGTTFGNISEGNLKTKPTSSVNEGNKLVMSGYATLASIVNGTLESVPMKRNGAKVTVTNPQTVNGVTVPGSESYLFRVYGAATQTSIVGATFTKDTNLKDAVAAGVPQTITAMPSPYVHPTANPGRDVTTRPFIIVQAPYGGTNYYYRLEFEKTDAITKTTTPLNINPNHWYQVMITEVTGKGEATASAAAVNPSTFIKADIIDYCPESYNMVTDGARELGVTHELVHNGDATADKNGNRLAGKTPGYIYVKLFSPDATEMTKESIRITSPQSWMKFNDIEAATSPEEVGTGEAAYKGVVFKVPVDFKTTKDPGELSGKIVVTWKGLQREIPVKWTRDFMGEDLCTVQLLIKEPGATNSKYSTGYTEGNDYWTFVHSTCRGLKTAQNNDSIRDSGLHFPINYGGKTAATRWTYEYKVKFKDMNEGQPFNWNISWKGISGVSVSRTSGTNVTGEVEVTVTRTPPVGDDWTYEVGTLTFTVSSTDGTSSTDYELDLYHTGFFDCPADWRPNTKEYRIDKEEPTGVFYYYEVRQGPAGTYYWLDRNLGSESAAMYIESDTGVLITGDPDAAGGYYMAADYNTNKQDPNMYSDLCPPGYEIPREDIWNTLKNSKSFTMNQEGSYYQAKFVNAKNQVVYFPKVRYYDATTKTQMGESAAGYYWSATAADGLEKDHIGNWLKYLKISGSIASYDNAEVNGRNNSHGAAMSVRCVNTTPKNTSVYRTHFNVAGATHVFIYSKNGDEKNPVYNWPGKPIGNYITMADPDQLFNFNYESLTTSADKFYVIFTFRDEAGIWHTMSKSPTGHGAIYTTDKGVDDLEGWKVTGGQTLNAAGTGVSPTTALGGTWKCSYNETTKKATVVFSN